MHDTLETLDPVVAPPFATDDAGLDSLSVLAAPLQGNVDQTGVQLESPLWPSEWLQDADLWDPTPPCPLEFQDDISTSLLNLYSQPAKPHLSERTSQEEPQWQAHLPAPVEKSLFSGTPNDIPPRRHRTTQPASNREHQKRYRNRQREKAAASKSLVASMTAELQQLKERGQQLESRNAVLEKLNQLNAAKPQYAVQGTSLECFDEDTYDVHETTASEEGPAMMVSIGNRQQFLTLTDLSRMSATSFSTLWASYVQEIAVLLLQDSPIAENHDRLNQLAAETSVLIGIIKSLNPQAFSVFNCGDKGQAGSPALDNTFYSKLAGVMGLSEGQIQDHLRLRRLCVIKRGLLAMQRKAIIDQTAQLDCFDHDAPDTVTQLSDLAASLRANAAQDYKVYLRLACASRRGMLTSRQWAIGIVHAYPLFPVLETWMTRLAADRGDLTRDQLLAMARLDDKEQEWQDLGRYVTFVCSKYMHDYVPMKTFLRPEQTQKNTNGSRTSAVSPDAIFGGV